MLEKTSDVLSRAGIYSLAGLKKRLYEELGNATTADVLNKAVGEIFASAPKSFAVISTGGGATDSTIRSEERRIIFPGNSDWRQPHINNFVIAGRLSTEPPFFKIHNNGGLHVFSKTLLGGLVGDVFAVQGIYAGADPELGHSMAAVLRPSKYSGGLNRPTLSLLLMYRAGATEMGFSVAGFAKECGLTNPGMPEREYCLVYQRLSDAAKSLAQKSFIDFESRRPEEENVYMSTNHEPMPSNVPYYVGRTAAVSIRNALLEKVMTARQTAEAVHYDASYTHTVIAWLCKNGLADICEGMPRDNNSAVRSTLRSRKLSAYVAEPVSLLGFSPEKAGLGGVWHAPKLDVPGLVRYRESLIDPIVGHNRRRAVFEEACREAYGKHIAYAGKK